MKVSVRWVIAICAASLVLAGACLAGALFVITDSGSAVCQQVNVVQTEIRGVLTRQKQGLPANPYFIDHPDQLAAAQASVAKDLKTFAALHC